MPSRRTVTERQRRPTSLAETAVLTATLMFPHPTAILTFQRLRPITMCPLTLDLLRRRIQRSEVECGHW